MSKRLGQPITQVRLTNVATVHLKKGGKRFEIACYRNKVVSWRQGLETDIDEVLQAHTVFKNVSKGELANSKDLIAAFGTDEQDTIIRHILDKGEYNVSDKEREVLLECVFKDIATIVSEKTVNPHSNRPYTITMIHDAMKDIHFAVNPSKSAKQQALEVIRRLKEHMPIERSKMHLRISCPNEALGPIRKELEQQGVHIMAQVEKDQGKGEVEILADPGLFRAIDELVRREGKRQGILEVLQMNVQQEGEADVDFEMARKEQLMTDNLFSRLAATKLQDASSPRAEKEREGQKLAHTGDSEEEEEEEEAPTAKATGGGRKQSKAAKRRVKEEKKEKEERMRQVLEKRKGGEAAGVENSAGSQGTLSQAAENAGAGGGKKFSCNTCKAGFSDAKCYRDHYRTDWHRYNLKLKEKGGQPVSEEEFSQVDAEELFFDRLS